MVDFKQNVLIKIKTFYSLNCLNFLDISCVKKNESAYSKETEHHSLNNNQTSLHHRWQQQAYIPLGGENQTFIIGNKI